MAFYVYNLPTKMDYGKTLEYAARSLNLVIEIKETITGIIWKKSRYDCLVTGKESSCKEFWKYVEDFIKWCKKQ